MSLTSSSSSMAEYGDCRWTPSRDALSAMAMRFIPPYLFLSRDDDDEVRVDIGKHDFRSVLPHPMLSSANQGHPVEIKLNVM